MFYRRFDIRSPDRETLESVVQQQYLVANPDFFPVIASISAMPNSRPPQPAEEN
jgi:hypothetical protein